MPLLFSVVARSTTVLAKHAQCAGNFTEVVDQILPRLEATNPKMSLSHGQYLFHYIMEDRLAYMCVTEDDFDRLQAFKFLEEIRRRFQAQYGPRVHTALPYAMNSEFSRVLAAEMRRYSAGGSPGGVGEAGLAGGSDRLTQVEGQVDELKGIMVKNIEKITERGEHLELLIDKTEDLASNSLTFRTSSRHLARKMWWKNFKMTLIIAFVIIVILYFIVSAACGGLAWGKCVNKKKH